MNISGCSKDLEVEVFDIRLIKIYQEDIIYFKSKNSNSFYPESLLSGERFLI